jgi:hypothetical protein
MRNIMNEALEKGIMEFSWVGEHVTDVITGNNQSITMVMTDNNETLSLDWHKPKWDQFDKEFSKINKFIKQFKPAKQQNLLGKVSGKARLSALLALQAA